MLRFVRSFVLPLTNGGILHVGRPLGLRQVDEMVVTSAMFYPVLPLMPSDQRSVSAMRDDRLRPVEEIARARAHRMRWLVPGAEPPRLDETSVRLAAAAHNLFALGDSGLSEPAMARQRDTIAEISVKLASLEPPSSVLEAAARYSLLARLPEVVQGEHRLTMGPSWMRLNLRAVGHKPSLSMRALARLAPSRMASSCRSWFKEVGFPPAAERVLVALYRACPVIEALDPLRLHPPISWRRLLSALRFAPLARLAAGRVAELGLETAGDALVTALLRFAAAGEGGDGPALPHELAFAIQFLAHTAWLHCLFGSGAEIRADSEIAALLTAAADVDGSLVWPSDIDPSREPRISFDHQITRLRAQVPGQHPERYRTLRSLCELAAQVSS